MIHYLQDFLDTWSAESESTHKVLQNLTDASLAQQVVPGGRTLGRIAWHVVASVPEMAFRTGLRFPAPDHETPVPASAKEIADTYQLTAQALRQALLTSWNDASLLEEDAMYGEQWPRGKTLEVLISHQAHHRGQMTVLMRQAGLVVPGVCGPSREEWLAFGMTPQE